MATTIRAAGPGDAALLADIVRRSFRDVAERFGLTRGNCPSHPSFCTDEWFANAPAKGVVFYVAEVGGLAAGCVALEPAAEGACYLERLAVLPEQRRHGVGAALVRHVFEEARERGFRRVEIAVIAQHEELRRWYERQGFRATGTQTFPHLPFEVLYMAAEA